MALKGMTKIELTNVKTGEVETVEKHNMVTNALKWVLSNPFGWQTKSKTDSDTLSNFLIPICPNIIGGVLLYEKQIAENANQLYAQPGNSLIGYANNETNATADTMRGSINVNESGPLETGGGYRFVFDFNTSQANGVIGSIGLTSKWGGGTGPDSAYVQYPWPTCLSARVSGLDIGILGTIVHYNDDTCVAASARMTSENNIEINKLWFPAKSWSLSEGISPYGNYKKKETKVIQTASFGAKSGGTEYENRKLFYCNFAYYDGYIWGFEHKGGVIGNNSGVANINWIKIDIETFDFTEGTFEINAQLYAFGSFTPDGYSRYADVGLRPLSAILGNYLYCYQYDFKKIVKINISNITDITFIDCGDGKKPSSGERKMCVFGGVVHTNGGYINGDVFVGTTPHSWSQSGGNEQYGMSNGGNGMLNCANGCTMLMGTYGVNFTITRSGGSATLSLIPNYLATINNLPAPVEKTADKTMKITYIIREEAET